MKGYNKIAEYYDTLNAYFDPEEYAERVAALFFEHGAQKNDMLLDLACGTGRISCALQNRGFDVTGIDLSEDMLSRACDNAWELCKKPPLFLHQDMRALDLFGTYRAAVCATDSLNYLTDKTSLEAAIASLSTFMEEGGLFFFDLNTKYRFEKVYAENAYLLECEDAYLGWQNEYDPKSRICKFYLSLFVRDADGRYQRYDEIQKEKYHPEKTVEKILADNGFCILKKLYDKEPECSEKVYYLCQKGKSGDK